MARADNWKRWGVLLVAGALAACSAERFDVNQARNVKPVEGTYYVALQQGYADVAQWKQDERNWDDSEILLAKSRQAASGVVPDLEAAPNERIAALRAQVQKTLAETDVMAHPVDAALVQVAYDCLAQSALNEAHPEGKAGHDCQTTFTEAMTALETAAPRVSDALEVRFDGKGVKLTREGNDALATLAKALQAQKPKKILISSYSDPKRRPAEEIVIAQKRATAVQKALEAHGISADVIQQMVYDDQGKDRKAGGALRQVVVSVQK